MSDLVAELKDEDFEQEVLKAEVPVLVDFWAPWCEPCKSMTPLIQEIAEDFDGKVKIVKVNVDENKKYAAQFKVRGIPNFILFSGGEIKEQLVGVVSKQDLTKVIEEVC